VFKKSAFHTEKMVIFDVDELYVALRDQKMI